jgi:peptide/nickel transport system substrate-binding protein/oligopeptide transport system substrate-binding protein
MLRLAATALVLLLVAVPAEGGEPGARHGGTYRYPLRLSPKTLDPARSTDIYTVTLVQQVFDGLVDIDQDLNLIPALARSWRVSRDGRVYTFELQPGVRFHNGRDVTAADVVYSLGRLLDPATASSAASQFEVIAGARDVRQGRARSVRGLRALDRARVEITLEGPYSPFLSLLAMKSAKIVPREAVEGREAAFERAPVGTGPFRFVRWDAEGEIVLEANPDYFRGRPYLDRIAYRIVPAGTDLGAIYRDFRSGRFDESPVPADVRQEVLADRAIRVVRRPVLGVQFYAFNLRRLEWRDRRTREAILVALDRTEIANAAFRGQHRPTAGLLAPGLLGYNPDRSVPAGDPSRAAALLKAAPVPETGQPIEVWSAISSPIARTEVEGVAASLRGLGLPVEARYAQDWPQFQQFLTEHRMSVFRYAWFADIPDPDNVLGILFHSKSEYNYMGYTSPEVDRLLERGRVEGDPVQRAAIYRQAEALILEDIPVIPFMHFWIEQTYQPYVKGIEVSALGAPYVPMRKVWLDRAERTDAGR